MNVILQNSKKHYVGFISEPQKWSWHFLESLQSHQKAEGLEIDLKMNFLSFVSFVSSDFTWISCHELSGILFSEQESLNPAIPLWGAYLEKKNENTNWKGYMRPRLKKQHQSEKWVYQYKDALVAASDGRGRTNSWGGLKSTGFGYEINESWGCNLQHAAYS